MLAAALGRLDVQGWSDDRGPSAHAPAAARRGDNLPGFLLCAGRLCCWSLKGGETGSQPPQLVMDVDSPLMSCAFHPESKTVICGGTFTGELVVWRVEKAAAC